MFYAKSSIILDKSISVSQRMDVIEERLKKFGYSYERKQLSFQVGKKFTATFRSWSDYTYMVFGVSKYGTIIFKENKITYKMPLFTQFFGLLALILVFSAIITNTTGIPSGSVLFSFLLFGVGIFLIVRKRNIKVAKESLKDLVG